MRTSFGLSLAVSALLLASPAPVQAQELRHPQTVSQAAAVVTASASGDSLRLTAPAEKTIRLEVFSDLGERVYDSNERPGNSIDWRAGSLAGGEYLYIVSTRDLSGRVVRHLGALSLSSNGLSLSSETPAASDLERIESLTARNGDTTKLSGLRPVVVVADPSAMVVATHDGAAGHVSSTSGALTLRTGDVLGGEDVERLRVTEDGRVGIGTATPKSALDVAGEITARDGIRFADGTVLKSAPKSSTMVAGGGVSANSAGTGTVNKIAKWNETGGTGLLADSAISDVGGNVGIGTSAPSSILHLAGTGGVNTMTLNTPGNQRVRLQTIPAIQNWGAFTLNANYNNGWNLDDTSTNGWFFKLDTRGGNTNNANNGLWLYRVPAGANPHTNETAMFGVSAASAYFAGNLGIGTQSPTQKLEVAGSLKLAGAGAGIIFPDGSVMTSAAAGGGNTPSGEAIITAVNDPLTVSRISESRLSVNLGRLNGANQWSGTNIFATGLSANNALVSNVGNPISAGDAVNKAYADANFVKFVPGAEQLSVGDANGTAPMINLRGGSTCCSGPGGHTPAFFKVYQNGSFVATGNLGIGTSPMEGKGYRTSWHTYKGAFRSGYADNEWDDANVGFFSWAGGSNSTASGLYALAFGDTNSAESTSSIVFGSGNQVKGAAGFSAGAGNRVCDTYGVALGNNARSGGPYIDGRCDPETFNIRGLAAVAIGYNVTADQDHTTAMGKFASNNGFQGTFIWSDGAPQASADTFRNTANNEFAARATGGFRFRTNLGGTTGCNLPAGSGVFNCTSSRLTKQNFVPVDGEDILARLRNVPVTTWNYINEGASVRHIGPMAEDFYAAFGLGTGSESIGVQDLASITLAAVKALDERTRELEAKTKEVDQLRAQLSAFEERLAALESKK